MSKLSKDHLHALFLLDKIGSGDTGSNDDPIKIVDDGSGFKIVFIPENIVNDLHNSDLVDWHTCGCVFITGKGKSLLINGQTEFVLSEKEWNEFNNSLNLEAKPIPAVENLLKTSAPQ